jgi:hypothetical protein
VQHDGWLEPGIVFQLLDRPYPQWTVKEVERVMRQRANDPEAARRLADCKALPDEWRAQLERAAANAYAGVGAPSSEFPSSISRTVLPSSSMSHGLGIKTARE